MSIRRIIYIGFFTIILLGLISIYMILKPEKNLLNTKPDYNLTAIELFNEYSTNEETANTKFLGKVIMVSGTIREINLEDSIYTTIILETNDMFFGVNCILNNKHMPIQKEIIMGSKAIIKGECSGLLIDVVLNNCVLINE